MSEIEVIRGLLDIGQAGLFLWLFLRVDSRLEKQNERHDQDIARLYDQRIADLKLLARTPTNLEGV